MLRFLVSTKISVLSVKPLSTTNLTKHLAPLPHCNQEIESIAKKIQNSEDFPNGVNVNFVQITDKFNIKLRVYVDSVGGVFTF
jgi:hypothetical protein